MVCCHISVTRLANCFHNVPWCRLYLFHKPLRNQRVMVLVRELVNLTSIEIQEQMEQKLDRMGRKSMTRRAFMHFQNGVREQCIDRANIVHAERQYKQLCSKKIFQYLRMASYRACLLRRVYNRRCQVFDFTISL